MQVHRSYDPIVEDEVMYWFDVLQDNGIDHISEITDIDRNKVQKILDEKLYRDPITADEENEASVMDCEIIETF